MLIVRGGLVAVYREALEVTGHERHELCLRMWEILCLLLAHVSSASCCSELYEYLRDALLSP